MLLLSALLLFTSCGGPYTARSISQPDEKLALAQNYFDGGSYGKAAVEYKDFIATFAGDERSDFAQFRLAESYRLDGDFALAAVEYRILITDYGYSEYVDDAFFLEGVCHFRQAQRAERDQTETYNALNKIERFLQLFPDSPRRDEAMAVREEIHDRLGRKAFLNAKLYFRGRHYAAALIYYDKIIADYPNTVWAARSHYFKGVVMQERGEKDEAIAEYAAALSSERSFPEKAHAAQRLNDLRKGNE
jgi:outer membrane protein assembly factor BamD